MTDIATTTRLIILLVVTGFSCTLFAQESIAKRCASTAGMQIYSNVFIHKETGDLLGYDLAIKPNGDSGVDALLYVYEGGESDDGVPLSGQILEKRLSVQGTWIEHLVEYPSKKEIVQKHFVAIVGILDSGGFRGELTIEGEHEQARLKHVKTIWSCKTWNPSSLK